MKILSIIITAYNSEPYISQLFDCLAPQVTDEVEVLVIDDGSDTPLTSKYPWAQIHRQENHGVSYSRNVGIDMSTGQYLAFIDADDLVSDKYIQTILERAKTDEFDYCYMSWKTYPNGENGQVKLNSIEDRFPSYNQCIWNRVYKKSFIGDLRFNTHKSIGEDAEFVKNLQEDGNKKSFIPDFMYYYRCSTPESLSKKFLDGRLCTRRVIYYFPYVTKSMSYLIEEFRELNKEAEIILMTDSNELPQLSQYALVTAPKKIHGTELRGFPFPLFVKVATPVKCDVVIWTEKTYNIGGIETFNYNLCKQLSPYYDIVVLYKDIDEKQKVRLGEFARVIKVGQAIECKTLIINRITDKEPPYVNYKKKVQMVHSCKWDERLVVPKDNDYLIPVSEAVARSYPDFKEDYKVINNVTNPQDTKRALILVSATRTGTNEKGQKRMVALCNLMKKRNIPYIWFCFSDYGIQNVKDICFVSPTLNITPYIKTADYLVQLSDHEGFCYSLVEALELGVPVLVTDLAVLPEIGVEDGKNAYIIPWEINDDFEIEKIYDHQLKGSFTYSFDNQKRVEQWKEVLGEGHPYEKKDVVQAELTLKAVMNYYDILTCETVNKGDIIKRNSLRAYELMQKRLVEMVIS